MIDTYAFGTPLYYTNDLPPFSGLKTEEILLALIIGGIIIYAANEYYKDKYRKTYTIKITKPGNR
jgi:hypothetical protein